MGLKKRTKPEQLRRIVQERGLTRIDDAEAAELRGLLEPISTSHFRRIVRDSGLPLGPLVEGVRQDTLRDLERTLLALLAELESNRPEARELVIESRRHARMAQDRAPTPLREEAILWMTVWLENSGVFREWLTARIATAARSTPL